MRKGTRSLHPGPTLQVPGSAHVDSRAPEVQLPACISAQHQCISDSSAVQGSLVCPESPVLREAAKRENLGTAASHSSFFTCYNITVHTQFTSRSTPATPLAVFFSFRPFRALALIFPLHSVIGSPTRHTWTCWPASHCPRHFPHWLHFSKTKVLTFISLLPGALIANVAQSLRR